MPTNLPASIGHYKIVKELGRSSFSTVYLAQPEDEAKAQPVALKVLDGSAGAGQEFLKQFRREVRLAAKLKHPHIIRIYDINNSQRTPFIAMEYVAGGTLRRD